MSGFIKWLEKLNESDNKVRSVLRRSLSFDPGTFVPAYPYVESFLKGEDSVWRREILYLVAGLWAMHWREGRDCISMPIGKACAVFDSEKRKTMSKNDRHKMTSTEKRFITFLDADRDQLAHRLRQMIALLRDHPVDFEALMKGLLYWNDDQKRTQTAWARDFYRNIKTEMEAELATQEDESE